MENPQFAFMGEGQNKKGGPFSRALSLARMVRTARTASRIGTGLPSGFREGLKQLADQEPPRDTEDLIEKALERGHFGPNLEARLKSGEPLTDAERWLRDQRDAAEIELLGSNPSGPENIDPEVLTTVTRQLQPDPTDKKA